MRILLIASVGFSIACFCWAYLCLPSFLFWALVPVAVLCGLQFRKKKTKPPLAVMCLITGFLLGMVNCHLYSQKYVPVEIPFEKESNILCCDYSWETSYGSAVEGETEYQGKKVKVRVYFNEKVDLEPGDLVKGVFRFSDSNQSQKAKSLYLTASQRGELCVEKAEKVPFRFYGVVLKHRCEKVLSEVIPEDSRPFAMGLLLGETSDLDYITDVQLRQAGIRHVVAVSGMHISVLFTLISLFTGRNRWVLSLVGLPITILFCWMVGFSPSVVRALIVQTMFLIAQLSYNRFDNRTALGFAALVILMRNPYQITSIGFQLSFAGAFGIAYFSRPFYKWLVDRISFGEGKSVAKGLWHTVCAAISLTTGAGVFTVPLSAYYFGCISLIGFVSNILLTLPITVCFYGTLLSCLFGAIWLPAGKIIGSVTGLLIRLVLQITSKLAAVPLGSVYTASVYICLWLFCTYVICFFLFRKKQVWKGLASVVVLLLLAVGMSYAEPWIGECRVTVLDVGQGQSVLLQSKGKNILVDCGGDSDTGSADTAAEYLLSRGIHNLDLIVISHIDRDHSGGIPYLLQRVSADEIWMPNYGNCESIIASVDGSRNWLIMDEDKSYTFETGIMSVFVSPNPKSTNESSLIVLFQTANCDILITGDQPKSGERALIDRVELPELELLVVGHHGASGSCSEELLESTSPDMAVISVGKSNNYGHPDSRTMTRLLAYGCRIYRTDEMGSILFWR